MKTVSLRRAFTLCFCALIFSLEGCDLEGEKVVTYEPITRESLTPEELKSLENMERIQAQRGGSPEQVGAQALQAAQDAIKNQAGAPTDGNEAKQ